MVHRIFSRNEAKERRGQRFIFEIGRQREIDGRWPMFDDRCSMFDVRWPMTDDRCSMFDVRWTEDS